MRFQNKVFNKILKLLRMDEKKCVVQPKTFACEEWQYHKILKNTKG